MKHLVMEKNMMETMTMFCDSLFCRFFSFALKENFTPSEYMP